MSKHETWRTRKYWKKVGGLLVEEFIAVPKLPNQGIRLIDGVIIKGEPTKIHKSNYFDIKGRDVICIQTKCDRLNMYLMGQAFFSIELLKRHKPKSVKSVIICGENDNVLKEVCKKYNMEVVVIPERIRSYKVES